MWDSLWLNATLATCASDIEDYGLHYHAALAVFQGKIAWLGPMSTLMGDPKTLAKEVVDCAGHLITPGLIDCHTHLVYAGDRATDFSRLRQGETYAKIAHSGGGILSTVQHTQEASFASLYQSSAKRLQQCLAHGVTSLEIKSGYGLICAHEIKQLEVIQALNKDFPLSLYPTFLGLHALPKQYLEKPDDYVAYVIAETLPRVAESNLAVAVDAFCETLAFTPAQVERFFLAAAAQGFSLKLHAEQLSETGAALLAAGLGALSADHLEYAGIKAIKAMALHKTVAVLLPGAFYYLQEQHPPPVDLLRTQGIPIALATDCNPGTSPCTNLLLMMNMACVLWGLTPIEALRATTIHAAKALGIAEDYGSLEAGKVADFVLWQVKHPDYLSYAIGEVMVNRVIKAGLDLLPF